MVTVKLAAELAVPAGVVTDTFPVVAPAGTVAVICVTLLTANEADVPLNLADVAPVKLLPVMVTTVPGCPLDGEKLLTIGGGVGAVTEKLAAEITLPVGVVTDIFPVVALAGTVVVI